MSNTQLIRLGGIAAIVAGMLRSINSFLPNATPGGAITLLYLVTDIFLLFGMMGLYGFQQQKSGLWGFFGFVLAIIGIATIRTGGLSGVDLYPIGTSIFATGLSAFAVGSWIAGKLPRWAALFWLVSTLIGFVGYFVPGLAILFAISGVLFGVGFAGGGREVYAATTGSSQTDRTI